MRRLHLTDWPDTVYLWTVTTDPNVIDRETALETMNRRWHIVNRSLKRISPGLRYFRVIELTESGLPHMHIIFDRYVDWNQFQRHLIGQRFGKVLHFRRVPQAVLFGYVTKYVSKTLTSMAFSPYPLFRIWSASVGFLPSISYHDPDGDFELFSMHKSLWFATGHLHSIDLYLLDHDHL